MKELISIWITPIVHYAVGVVARAIDFHHRTAWQVTVTFVAIHLMLAPKIHYARYVMKKSKRKRRMSIKIAKYEDFKVGDSASMTKTVTQTDVTLFAGITMDMNPLHVNAEFAKKSMFGKRLVHGAFSSGLISAVLGMKLPGPGALYLDQLSKFKKPVFIDDTITATCTIKEKVVKKNGKMKLLKIETIVTNQDDVVVTEGEATIMVMG